MVHEKPPGTGRIETFVDGVVAIIITIMVLELKIPAEVFSEGRFDDVLAKLGPKLAVLDPASRRVFTAPKSEPRGVSNARVL